MSKLINRGFVVFILLTCVTTVCRSEPEKYSIGSTATVEQISGWDIDVRPDGTGLPDGSGSVEQGELIYEEKCASCHGSFGEGMDRWPILAGGEDTLTEDRPEKTVGSYWPYLSTLWDYIHRAMPFLQPQSMEDNEVYAVTAYILHLNELVDADFTLSKENFTSVKLPNEIAFVDDPRPDVNNDRCMSDCRDPQAIKITWDSTDLGVTPTQHLDSEEALVSPAVVSSDNNQGELIYKSACAVCHDAGAAGAPVTGDSSAWTARLAQGIEILVDHATNGYQGEHGFMPAKGGNADLEDEQINSAVLYMINLVN